MVRKDWFTSVLFITLAVYAGWVSITDLSVGSFTKPGPGFFPFLSCLAIVILASITLFKRLAAKKLVEKAPPEGISWQPPMITLFSLVCYTFLLDVLGYTTITFLFIFILLKAVEKKSWVVSTLAALGVTAGAHIIFESILKSQLPSGPFGF